MREILFRGKANKKWAYGDLWRLNDGRITIRIDGEIFPYEVIPETVGQYTGLTDKNGKRIFEDDIVNCKTKYGEDIGRIVLHEGKFQVFWDSKLNYPQNAHFTKYYDINSKTTIIGNIHDNPELLEVQDNDR